MGKIEGYGTNKEWSLDVCRGFQRNIVIDGGCKDETKTNEMMQTTRLIDIGYKGQPFTRTNSPGR